MRLAERRQQLDALLLDLRELWHPQPFRELQPGWVVRWPALAADLLALPEGEAERINDDGHAAIDLLARHVPVVRELRGLISLPELPISATPARGAHWAWEIPGRKRQQIEAFVGACAPGGDSVLDWCCGKGHLGRLAALAWQRPVEGLEIDPALCEAGRHLARRAGAEQVFTQADALQSGSGLRPGHHALALHACGNLHRRLITEAAKQGAARLDIAPCCYYRGLDEFYEALAPGAALRLTRDDTRLAVTETVTAPLRERRERDREMAWKLGFDAWRREVTGQGYRTFKPVPQAWMRNGFADFLVRMAQREGLPTPTSGAAPAYERAGWQRQREVMRYSVVRHAFRRALELWLVLDLAVFLENKAYAVSLGTFCERRLTPRNILISALA